MTVALYVLNTANHSFSSTGDTTTTGSNGSYSLTYSGSGLDYFLVVVVTPSGNTLYNIAFGSLGVPNITMNIDELTTAQAVYAFQQAGGTMTSSGNGIPLGSISNYSQLYNDLPTSPSNTYTVGFSHASVSPNLPSTAASEIETLADALASCVQSTSYCSSVKGNLPNYTSGDGMFIYILIGNYTNGSMQTVLNNLISAISSLNVPWTSPTPTSSSSTTTTNVTTYTYAVGSYPDAIAIGANGNVWVVNNANYTGNSVTELSPTGSTLGTYTVGYVPDAIAIDSMGNVWVASNDNDGLTELNASGVTIGNYAVGSDSAIAIDGSGNVWVGNNLANGNTANGNVVKLSSTGTIIGTYTVGNNPWAIAIDSYGNVWVANNNNTTNNSTVTELSSTGTIIGTYTVGGGPQAIAIDANGNVWIANTSSADITELGPNGTVLATYYNVGIIPDAIAIDGSGNVWVANGISNNITELVGVATGVKTPLVLQPK